MSLLDIARPSGKHRVPSVRELQWQLAESRRARQVAKAALSDLAAENTLLQRQLDEAGIELSGARLDLEAAREEGSRLRAELANATSVSVPSGRRDIDPDDQPTQPVPRVMFLGDAPFAVVPGSTDPAHIPGQPAA